PNISSTTTSYRSPPIAAVTARRHSSRSPDAELTNTSVLRTAIGRYDSRTVGMAQDIRGRRNPCGGSLRRRGFRKPDDVYRHERCGTSGRAREWISYARRLHTGRSKGERAPAGAPPSSMRKSRLFLVAGMIAVATTGYAQRPAENVNPKRHPNIAAAQRL